MTAVVYWRDNWEAALKEAKEANRPLVLEFYMEGCPHCQRMHQETHTDQAVAAALNTRFIPVRLEGRQPPGGGAPVQRHRGAHHPDLLPRRPGTASLSRILPACRLP